MANNYTYVKGAEFPYQYKYEHMAVTTDCVIFTYENRSLKVLLIRRGGEPYKGQWAFPGGFLRMNETAMEGALRELKEETSLTRASIRELGVFSDVDRDPRERVITVAWYALVKHSEVIGGDDADEAGWYAIDQLPPLAFDHNKIFEAAMERLRRDIHFEPIGFDLLNETFTIPDLQRLYETILGTTFDRRNFQRKLLSTGILEAVSDEQETSDETPPVVPNNNTVPSGNKKRKLIDAIGAVGAFCEIDTVSTLSSVVATALSGTVIKTDSKKKPGRAGTLFRLNKRMYAKLKEDVGKTEF